MGVLSKPVTGALIDTDVSVRTNSFSSPSRAHLELSPRLLRQIEQANTLDAELAKHAESLLFDRCLQV